MRTSRSCRHITRFWGVFCGSIFPGTIQLRLRLHSSCGPPPATLFRPASTPPSRGPRRVANRRPGSGGQAPVVSSAGNKSAAPTGQTIRLEQAPSRATNPPPPALGGDPRNFLAGCPTESFPTFSLVWCRGGGGTPPPPYSASREKFPSALAGLGHVLDALQQGGKHQNDAPFFSYWKEVKY